MTFKRNGFFAAMLAIAAFALCIPALSTPAQAASDITDPEECSDMDGRWGNYGGVFECNLSTLDGGTECYDAADCESVCVTENDASAGTETFGHCYDWTITRGTCMNYVNDGKASGLVCED